TTSVSRATIAGGRTLGTTRNPSRSKAARCSWVNTAGFMAGSFRQIWQRIIRLRRRIYLRHFAERIKQIRLRRFAIKGEIHRAADYRRRREDLRGRGRQET